MLLLVPFFLFHSVYQVISHPVSAVNWADRLTCKLKPIKVFIFIFSQKIIKKSPTAKECEAKDGIFSGVIG